MENFETYLLILGLLLAAGSLLSGLAHRSILSLAILFLVAGIILGDQVTGVLELDATSELVKRVTEVTLILILFVDGMEVEAGMLRRSWHVPLRSLLIAMPLTAGLIAAAGVTLLALSWKQALLLGALLSPTDPVLTSSVITNTKIPLRVRHSLNLESGFNDGLALPAVLIFATALGGAGTAEAWWRFLARDLLTGASVGVAGALIAVWLLRPFRGRLEIIPHYRSLYAFGVALTLYGAARYLGGNGFIAVFLGGIVIASQMRGQTATFERFSRDASEVFKAATFVIFGSLLAAGSLAADGFRGLALALFVLFVARTAALLPSLWGTRLDWPERLFMAWFGPKGVACIAYALLVLGMDLPGGEEIFNLAALVVFGSIILHGATDTPLADWFGNRAASEAAARRSKSG